MIFYRGLINIRTFQLNCKYLGNRVENEIVEAVCAAPQLLKLGIALEFRDALNKTAIQLLKNLDRSKCSPLQGVRAPRGPFFLWIGSPGF